MSRFTVEIKGRLDVVILHAVLSSCTILRRPEPVASHRFRLSHRGIDYAVPSGINIQSCSVFNAILYQAAWDACQATG